MAFSFGLLHGFGFASALSEIGLPRSDIPLALFAFNVGVVVGQLIFIATVLAALSLARQMRIPEGLSRQARPLATYAIGTLAAFWFVDRVAGFLPQSRRSRAAQSIACCTRLIPHVILVRVRGFEPPTSCSQNSGANDMATH